MDRYIFSEVVLRFGIFRFRLVDPALLARRRMNPTATGAKAAEAA